MNRPSTDFTGCETILYNTIILTMYIYNFFQVHRAYETKREQYCDLWTSGDNVVSIQVLQSYQSITLKGGVNSGRVYTCVCHDLYGKSLYFPLNTLKNKLHINK